MVPLGSDGFKQFIQSQLLVLPNVFVDVHAFKIKQHVAKIRKHFILFTSNELIANNNKIKTRWPEVTQVDLLWLLHMKNLQTYSGGRYQSTTHKSICSSVFVVCWIIYILFIFDKNTSE